jgi:hypothetical protein
MCRYINIQIYIVKKYFQIFVTEMERKVIHKKIKVYGWCYCLIDVTTKVAAKALSMC